MKKLDQEFLVAIAKYIDKAVEDYKLWCGDRENADEQVEEFRNEFEVKEGQNYIKIITKSGGGRSVHSFIVKEDGPKFKKGDILKPASWAAPAKNKARGNIFDKYIIQWTGPLYLRG